MLVIGSERGFCGEFNEQLLKEIVSTTREDPGGENAAPQLIAVGNKLCDRLRDRGFESIALEGATVAEDLPDVLVRVVEALADLQQKHPVLCLQALIHGVGPAPLQTKQLLPPFQGLPPAEAHAYPPLMYLSPAEFYGELLKHYLGAVLGHLLHASLLAENDQRVRHLEGAIQRLEEKTSDLERRSRALRQEEITEEIEIILLSVECGIRGPRGGVLQVNPPNSTV
jgi:F-type H+-transporting ATPase subunit gamma